MHREAILKSTSMAASGSLLVTSPYSLLSSSQSLSKTWTIRLNATHSCRYRKVLTLSFKPWLDHRQGEGGIISSISATSSTSLPGLTAIVEARVALAVSTGRLDLSDCGLVEVPPRVFEIADLVDLSLAGNNIRILSDDIKNLRAILPGIILKATHRQCHITVSGSIGSVWAIYMWKMHLDSDSGVSRPIELRRLGLAGNALQELPDGICNLPQLEGLWVHGNNLHALPPQIGDLRQLRMLALAGNKLTSLPESISGLSNLQILSIAGNDLQEIPAEIGNLKVLRVLAAYGNHLHKLPGSLNRLASLQDLWLQGNKLEVLPKNLDGLCSLKQFSLADNLLKVLPDSIGELQSLETLWVYGNKLDKIPRSLTNLKKLLYIWMESNPLDGQYASEILPSFGQLKAVGISSNVELSEEIPVAMEKVVYVSEISGSGDARSRGGYFKLQQWDKSKKSDLVVVAFGSAPGVPNWAGLLRKIRAEMATKGSTLPFDILYVVDTKRSWYTHEECLNSSRSSKEDTDLIADNSREQLGLGSYYRSELEVALKSYKHVIMLGDSMGASATLLFSPLATSIIAFCPQVDLSTSSIRPGQAQVWLKTFKEELLAAVSSSSAKIFVHTGTWSHDVDQAKLLPSNKVKLEVHDVNDHRLAKELDKQNVLVRLVLKEIREVTLAHQASLAQ